MKLNSNSILKQIFRFTLGLYVCVNGMPFGGLPELAAQEESGRSYTPGSTSFESLVSVEERTQAASSVWVAPVTEAKSNTWKPPATAVEVPASKPNSPESPSPEPVVEKPTEAPTAPAVEEPSQEPAKETAPVTDTVRQLESLAPIQINPLVEESEDAAPVIPATPNLVVEEHTPTEPGATEAGSLCSKGNSKNPEIQSGFAGQSCNATEACKPLDPLTKPRLITLAPGPKLFTPVRNILGRANLRLAGNEEVYAVGQLSFLSFARDYGDQGRLLTNGAPNLFANGPDEGDFTGVDISYGRRRSGGKGWEMRYIGFNPETATDASAGDPFLVWGGLAPPLNDPATWGGTVPGGLPETYGLSGLGIAGLNMGDIFNDASNHRISRDSEFGSFEFNLLRASAGKHRFACGNALVELFGGLRAVAFNETTTFTGAATSSAIFPRSAFYSSEVKNSLFGLQVGGRLERQLSKGFGLNFGTRIGVYNNRIENRQHAEYQFADGSTRTPQLLYGSDAGREFDVTGTANELEFLGELDFGIVYQFRQKTRARIGYRGIVITNVADAGSQFEDSLFDLDTVADPNASSNFIVGGLYFGVDHAF